MTCNGLYQYWLDEDDRGPFLITIPAFPPKTSAAPAFYPLWKGTPLQEHHSRASEIASLCSLLQSLDEDVPTATYFMSLEKLGDLVYSTLAHFHHLPEDAFTGLDCSAQIYAAVPPACVFLALCALKGNRQGLAEARSSLCLISGLLALPKLSAVYREHRGLHNLVLLLTHPNDATTQLKLAVMSTLDSLLLDPEAALAFLENKFSRDFMDVVVHDHLAVPRKAGDKSGKEPTKRQKQDDYSKPTVLETGYQIILGQMLQSPSPKLANSLRLFLSKCGFYLELSSFPRVITDPDPARVLKTLDSIKKKLKQHLLQSSSKSFQSVKHDLQSAVLLDSSRTVSHLRSAMLLLGQPVLTRTLAAWLDSCDVLDCCSRLVGHRSAREMGIQDYRVMVCNVAEVLVALLRSRGGAEYFTAHRTKVEELAEMLSELRIQDCDEEGDLSLIEEENLLSVMQMEKVPSYARQLAGLLQSLLKLSDLFSHFFSPHGNVKAAADLYCYLNSTEQKPFGLFYHYVRLHPDLLVAMVEHCSLSNTEGILVTFYILEVLQFVLYEDRAGEVLITVGCQLHTFLKSLPKTEAPPEMQQTIETLVQQLEPSARLETSSNLLEDLLHYVSHNARLEPVTDLKALNLVEPIQSLSKLSRLPAPKVTLSSYGLMTEPNSPILKLLPSLRLLSAILALNKWSSALLIERGFLRTLSGIIYQVTSILQTMHLQTMAEVVFNVQDKSQQKKEHFEVLLPGLNVMNLFLHQLLATDLQCYNDSVLFETLVALNAVCELNLAMGGELTVKKVQKLVTTTFILWAQFPLFAEEYLVQLLEQALHFPYKHAPTLNLASAVFEHLVSYKNPGFVQKYVTILMKSPSPMVFSPCLLHFHLTQAKTPEDQAAVFDLYVTQWERLKEVKPSKMIPRLVWETRRQFALVSESELCVLERFIDAFVITNSHDLQQALVRLLRCVLATNHEESCNLIVRKLLASLRGANSSQAKVLHTIYGIIDVPAAKSLMIYEDLPEDLIRMLESKELRLLALRILRVLFDVKIGLCSEEMSKLKTAEETSLTQQQSASLGRYKLVEDMPTVSHTQQFLAECKRFLTFKLPEGVALEGDIGMDDDDPLYSEFKTHRSISEDQNSVQCTALVYRILFELSQHPLGKSLLLCGEFPHKDQAPLVEFGDTVQYVTATLKGCEQEEWVCKMLGLTDLILSVLKEVGARLCPRESLHSLQRELMNSDLPRASYYLSLMTQIPESIDPTSFDLPHPRGLSERFTLLQTDPRKLIEFQDKSKRAQREQLVLCERLGERIQVKAIHSLTDLLPPPYPPLFRFKSDIEENEWTKISAELTEFVPEISSSAQKENEDREKKAAKPPVFTPAPVMPPMPMPMNPMYPGMMQQGIPPPGIARPPMPMHMEDYMRPTMMPQPILPPSNLFSPEDHKAIEEIKRLLNLQNERADPRIQSRIAQILSEHPNVQPFIQSRTD